MSNSRIAAIAPPQANQLTTYNPKYSILNFLEFIEVQYNNGLIETIPDYLNWDFNKLIDAITSWSYQSYDRAIPLTSVSYLAYGTDTLWWFLMMYNGLIHPLEVPNGTVLRIPQVSNVQQFNSPNQNTQNNVGSVVSF